MRTEVHSTGYGPGRRRTPPAPATWSLTTIRDVLDACPAIEWKLIVALSRMAGLRCPSEIGSLTWDAINWEKGALTVLAKKTEHHGGDHAVRIVPICPKLRAILAEAFELTEPGTELVVPTAARKGVNVRTHLERIIVKAGHKPWPRLLQNLRASCETDWVEKYPAHVVAPWLGHSPKVAAQHYLMSREHHFAHVVSGGAATAATGAKTPPGGPPPCDAYCAAPATHLATQQAAAAKGTPRHETTEPAATTGFAAGSSEVTPHSKSGVMAGAGGEHATFLPENGDVASAWSANCRSLSDRQLEQLAIAVGLVASMDVPDEYRPLVLNRVMQFVAHQQPVDPCPRTSEHCRAEDPTLIPSPQGGS